MYKVTDIDDYQDRLTDEQAKVLIEHCNEYNIFPNICAWYDDMEDFYTDWIHDNNIFETEEQADWRFKDGVCAGEFIKFDNGEIIRLIL